MNEESRVAKLYTKILHNLKTKDCTHKLCFIKKNNKVEPIILRVNLSLNTTSDAYKTSSASCEGTRTIISTGQHRKYRLIEPIVKPRPKLADSEKELEDELQVFKAEVEKKYQESQTNKSYKYPLQSRNSQCIFANSDDDVHTENMAGS
jgi:UDP-N-acetylenolpyruvoylglucosamine reductase